MNIPELKENDEQKAELMNHCAFPENELPI